MTGSAFRRRSQANRIESPSRVGDNGLLMNELWRFARWTPDRGGGVGDRTLSCIGRAEPSGDCLLTDSIETSTDNLINV